MSPAMDQEVHPRSDVMRAIRLGNFAYAFTLAQIHEKELSSNAKIAICRALSHDEGIEMGLGDQLALKWGVYRIVNKRHR